MNWREILTAVPPPSTPLWVKCASHPEWGEHFMEYNPNTQRWEGRNFTAMGPLKTFWADPTPPTHWRRA